jgi:hypothetical protein
MCIKRRITDSLKGGDGRDFTIKEQRGNRKRSSVHTISVSFSNKRSSKPLFVFTYPDWKMRIEPAGP